MSIKLWVVMGNDYPAGVFASEESADEFILFKKWHALVETPNIPYQGHRVHWRHYIFILDQEVTPITLRPGQSKAPRAMTNEEFRHEWFYWYHREVGRQGAAASAANEFRRGADSELQRRGIKIHEDMARHYHSLVAAQRGSFPSRRKPRNTGVGDW